jgi:hypothetical protein
LRELWHAVPPGASASEIKTTYQQLFGTPIEALFEPWVYVGELSDGEPYDVPRYPCDFSLCVAPVRPFDDEGVWAAPAPGPFDCADDPHAVGPATAAVWVDPVAVWREYTLEHELGPYALEVVPGQTDPPRVVFSPCYPTCSDQIPRYDDPPPGYIPLGTPEHYRVQVGLAVEDLPVDGPPPQIEFSR